MVSMTTRKMYPTSESTMTNDGRISPPTTTGRTAAVPVRNPGVVGDATTSRRRMEAAASTSSSWEETTTGHDSPAEEQEKNGLEEEQVDESSILSPIPMPSVPRLPPPRVTSSGTAISALTMDSGSSSVAESAGRSGGGGTTGSSSHSRDYVLLRLLQASLEGGTTNHHRPIMDAPPMSTTGNTTIEGRDVCEGTTGTTTTSSSMDGDGMDGSKRETLRVKVQQRKMSLTEHEYLYLDQLLLNGNELDLQSALERLQDEELFFDHTTPRHYRGQPLVDEDDDYDDDDDDKEHKEDESSHHTGPRPPLPTMTTLQREMSQGSCSSSVRRLQVLEERRNSVQHLTLWRAHKSGLALSGTASRASIVRRASGGSSVGGGVSISSSSGTGGTGGTMMMMMMPRVPPSNGDIFRTTMTRKTFQSPPGGLKRHVLPPLLPGRSSGTAAAMAVPSFRRSQSLRMVPDIPISEPIERISSSTSRKSVTFTAETDGTPKPKQKTPKVLRRTVSDTNVPDRKETIPSATNAQGNGDKGQNTTGTMSIPTSLFAPVLHRLESTSSIPSLHHATPIRQDSISSIPSLHHAHPIRQESISSIPSLHHAHPIRQESISSLPSGLSHPDANDTVRQESISSIPSLHHAHPIRQESISSIPTSLYPDANDTARQESISSIPSLHHAHPIRQESISSIPTSLHHAHPIRQESTASIPSLHHGTALMDDASASTAMGGQKFEPSNDIANAWIQQQFLRRQASMGSSSVPHNVTFPSVDDTEETFPETIDTLPTEASTECTSELLPSSSKPILLRLASQNAYEGEGIEATELADEAVEMNEEEEEDDDDDEWSSHRRDSNSRQIPIMVPMDASIRTCNSWDTGMSSSYYYPQLHPHHPLSQQQQQEANYNEIFRNPIVRSLSHDDPRAGKFYLGTSAELLDSNQGLNLDETSWDTTSDAEEPRMDSWNILKDEYPNGYGGDGTLDFLILGTHADDEAAQPHVLSPPLMESLQAFLPYTKSGENFYLKYSMVRDGASLPTFLKRARGVHYSVLAVETVDGEVFGAFTCQPWRKNWNYFGTGESFLWKMRRSRLEKTHGILEQAHLESEIDVYPYTGENRYIQLCTHDRIAVGGGTPSEKKEGDEAMTLDSGLLVKPHEWGFGLAIAADFLTGTSSPCVTFGSPGLSNEHQDGSIFEIVNMELWTLTPCRTEAEAEKLELGKLFLSRD